MNFTKSADGRISDKTFNLGNKLIKQKFVNKLVSSLEEKKHAEAELDQTHILTMVIVIYM